jgi:AraC-like DNA-binding protein
MKYLDRLNGVKLYIGREYRTPFDVDGLAKRFGFSRSTLAHGFKTAYGLSPMSYARDLRITDAARLLADGHPVKEAMYAAGMHSPSAFSRAFSRKYSVPPSEFKRHALFPCRGGAFWAMTSNKRPDVLQHVSIWLLRSLWKIARRVGLRRQT